MADTKLDPHTEPNKIWLNSEVYALVDPEDFEYLSKYRWVLTQDAHNQYATRYVVGSHKSKQSYVKMHRHILGVEDRSIKIDHINGNGLDNRKCNLRTCRHQQNMFNQGPKKGSSKYKGVSWSSSKKLWVSQIQVGGQKIYLGQFKDEIEAARAYDKGSKEYHKEFGYLNFRDENV